MIGRAGVDERVDCTCTEDDSSDGSACLYDDPYCPLHGDVALLAAELVSLKDALSNEVDKSIWICALDRVAIDERIEWTRRMRRQYDETSAAAREALGRPADAS